MLDMPASVSVMHLCVGDASVESCAVAQIFPANAAGARAIVSANASAIFFILTPYPCGSVVKHGANNSAAARDCRAICGAGSELIGHVVTRADDTCWQSSNGAAACNNKFGFQGAARITNSSVANINYACRARV